MAQIHVVKQSESLSTIAHAYGFQDYHTVYEHPANADFRKKRPNPNLIVVGDTIVIPERVVKTVATTSGKAHLFKVKAVAQPVELLISVLDELSPGAPFVGLTLSLVLPHASAQDFVTDAKGEVHLVAPTLTAGLVDVVRIRDAKEPAIIKYDAFAHKQVSTNQCHVLRVPDKRKVIDRIARTHGVLRRAAWGARPPKYGTMDEDWDYTTVVIHHSGNSGEKDPRKIEEKHMVENGWDDVGYHYLVTPPGVVYEGRHLAYKGSHVEAANTQKIGILIMGDFDPNWWDSDDDTPTPSQMSTAEALVKTLKKELGTVVKLGGHRDYKATTECPGDAMYTQLAALRKATGLGGP